MIIICHKVTSITFRFWERVQKGKGVQERWERERQKISLSLNMPRSLHLEFSPNNPGVYGEVKGCKGTHTF